MKYIQKERETGRQRRRDMRETDGDRKNGMIRLYYNILLYLLHLAINSYLYLMYKLNFIINMERTYNVWRVCVV